MHYANASTRARDRHLGRATDLFTIDLLVWYITWKLERDRDPARAVPEDLDPCRCSLVAPDPPGATPAGTSAAGRILPGPAGRPGDGSA